MRVYSVSEYRGEMNELLSQVSVVIQGEVSGFNVSRNRFVWFSLVDEDTSIDCFMMIFQLRTPIEDGMEIRVTGTPTMFKKGKVVFRPRFVEPVGDGALQRAFAELKARLEKEGVFDDSRKRVLPRFPQRIGLVTSRDAAAYTDVLRILNNRWPSVEIVHVNVSVQGGQAVPSIVAGLATLNAEAQELDCIILTRGGGSMEDLHAFNTEEVVRAVFASTIPVVTGVGHERDTTLVDFVADKRASTPSNAAEFVVPHMEDVSREVDEMVERLYRSLQLQLQQEQRAADMLIDRFDAYMRRLQSRYQMLTQRLGLQLQAMSDNVRLYLQRIHSAEQLLQAHHPQRILDRGYTITRDSSGSVIRSASQLSTGDTIVTTFADGEQVATID